MAKKKVKEQTGERVKALENQLVRTLADYDNLQKRVAREREEMTQYASLKFILRLLPVFDMLYGAQEHLQDAGLAMAIKELEDTLKNEGIVEIKAEKGMKFNEEEHEATETVENSELENGQIAKVVLKGWKYEGGPVIRHAKVIVNKVKAI